MANSIQVPKRILKEIVWGSPYEGYTPIQTTLEDTSRWSIHYTMVFSFEGRFYEIDYSEGATESQYEPAFHYSPDICECFEVERVEVVKTEYRRIE